MDAQIGTHQAAKRSGVSNENGHSSKGKAPISSAVPRLLLWKNDLCAMLGVKIRTLERMISAGEIPPPNRQLRGRPPWIATSIQEWVDRGCPVILKNSA